MSLTGDFILALPLLRTVMVLALHHCQIIRVILCVSRNNSFSSLCRPSPGPVCLELILKTCGGAAGARQRRSGPSLIRMFASTAASPVWIQ